MTNAWAESATPAMILSRTAFFGQLTPDQIERVADLGTTQDFEEGQQVYRLGEVADLLYVVVHGTIRQTITFGVRSTNVGDVMRPGEVFGWAALTPTCNVRITTTSCLTSCRFLAIEGAGLLRLMELDHTLGYRLMTQLTRLITGTMTAFAGG